mmetsp:Transcript_12691/g.19418  ORF Transcript_12691/g.19418 Transcript_12691/m.19418 type:complete len:123 (-) Transcript_12691:197-565(-)
MKTVEESTVRTCATIGSRSGRWDGRTGERGGAGSVAISTGGGGATAWTDKIWGRGGRGNRDGDRGDGGGGGSAQRGSARGNGCRWRHGGGDGIIFVVSTVAAAAAGECHIFAPSEEVILLII